MKLVVCCTRESMSELLHSQLSSSERIRFVDEFEEALLDREARVIVDLLFENNHRRVQCLRSSGKTVVVNGVIETLSEIDDSFFRTNGWPGFLASPRIEITSTGKNGNTEVAEAFATLGKELEWVPDITGLVSARVISSIINEAYFALDEGVSTREEIDLAMRLGTAYPYGPFEWASLIGLERVANLLLTLSRTDERYRPCELLLKEAVSGKI